jgi:nicotinic acid mononucleotide adenylyltransferase
MRRTPTRTEPTAAERRRLAPLAAALARARAPGPPRLELVAGTLAPGRRHGLLAGTFNPFTRAHAALAVAGRRAGCERVVLVMAPASLDKETMERAHPIDRLDWVRVWAVRHRWAAVAVSSHPLLVDMAEALAGLVRGEVALLVGADKAAQLADARYYDDLEAALARLAGVATLLVADRVGHPGQHGLPAARLPTAAWVPTRSATEVRAVAGRGGDLGPLVPAPVARRIARTGAYDDDPSGYLARTRWLDALVPAGPGHGGTGAGPA